MQYAHILMYIFVFLALSKSDAEGYDESISRLNKSAAYHRVQNAYLKHITKGDGLSVPFTYKPRAAVNYYFLRSFMNTKAAAAAAHIAAIGAVAAPVSGSLSSPAVPI